MANDNALLHLRRQVCVAVIVAQSSLAIGNMHASGISLSDYVRSIAHGHGRASSVRPVASAEVSRANSSADPIATGAHEK